MNRTTITALMALLAIGLIGCTETPNVGQIEKICSPLPDVQMAMDAAEDVLVKMNFSIVKADVKHGYILTHPLRAGQNFEFWRKDNVGSFNSAEANLHTIRRTIEMNITKQDGQTCVDCIAIVERMSLPERQADNTSQAASLFTKSGGTTQKIMLNPSQEKNLTWIDLGRDIELENEILRQLKAKL